VGLLKGRKATLAAALVAIGLVSQIPTTVGFMDRYFVEAREQHVGMHELRWERFALVDIWSTAYHEVRDAVHTDVKQVVNNAGGQRSQRLADIPVLHIVALWWWVLPAAGIPRWLGGIACLLGLLAAGRILWLASGKGVLRLRAGPARRRPAIATMWQRARGHAGVEQAPLEQAPP
jgi:hypothetical protein